MEHVGFSIVPATLPGGLLMSGSVSESMCSGLAATTFSSLDTTEGQEQVIRDTDLISFFISFHLFDSGNSAHVNKHTHKTHKNNMNATKTAKKQTVSRGVYVRLSY